jgi:cytoskeletal protein CcmA (bactofilin family)
MNTMNRLIIDNSDLDHDGYYHGNHEFPTDLVYDGHVDIKADGPVRLKSLTITGKLSVSDNCRVVVRSNVAAGGIQGRGRVEFTAWKYKVQGSFDWDGTIVAHHKIEVGNKLDANIMIASKITAGRLCCGKHLTAGAFVTVENDIECKGIVMVGTHSIDGVVKGGGLIQCKKFVRTATTKILFGTVVEGYVKPLSE